MPPKYNSDKKSFKKIANLYGENLQENVIDAIQLHRNTENSCKKVPLLGAEKN